MNISNREQQIYNCHLKHFRNGCAWKPRKDFSDITSSTHLFLQKLSAFFEKFKHIDLDDFFGAPRELHPDEPTPPLKFFITRAAIKSYSMALKLRLDRSPDKQIESIKKGLEFIILFCLEKNISFEDYPLFKQDYNYVWLEHYRTNQINPYCLMEVLNFTRLSEQAEGAVWNSDLVDNFFTFRSRYHNSKDAKQVVKEGTKKIQNFLKEKLKVPSKQTNITSN